MGSTAGAIRAGRAFVELFISDESVKASLENVKSQLKSFGSSIDSVSSQSLSKFNQSTVSGFNQSSGSMAVSTANLQGLNETVQALQASMAALSATMSATWGLSTARTAGTTASVGLLTAGLGVLRSSVYAVGNAFRVVFSMVSASVFRAVAGIGVLAAVVAKIAPSSKFAGFINGFLNKSQTTEAIGRWTRFAGAITGSTVLRDLGNRIERLGLGSAIVKGFQGGLLSGISSTFGAGVRSARSIILGGLANVFTAPIRGAATAFRGTLGALSAITPKPRAAATSAIGVLPAGASSLGAATAGTNALTAALTRATGAAYSLNGALSILKTVGASIAGAATKIAGLSAAISGPALIAAKTFVTSSKEMMKNVKEIPQTLPSFHSVMYTDISNKKLISQLRERIKIVKENEAAIREVIEKKYGEYSKLINPKDVKAASEMSELFTKLKQSTQAAWAQIGAAALPVLKQITERTIAWMDAVGRFLNKNRGLIQTVVETAVKVAGLAAGIVTLYGAFSAAVPIVTMLLSPLGLVAVSIAGIAYLFPVLRTEAISVFSFLFGNFAKLGTIAQQTMDGIRDAMSGGSLSAAARVLWAGLNLAWLTGSEQLRAVWRNMVTSMSATFINLYAGILKGWVVVTNGFISVWTATQNFIAQGMARLIAMWTGQSVEEVLATLGEMQQQDKTDREKKARQRLDEIEAERQAQQEANGEVDEAKRKQAEADLKAAKKEFEEARKSAEALRKANSGNGADIASGLKNTATLGTFNVATTGRTNVGGLADLKKSSEDTADNTKQIADNTKNGGMAFA